MDKEEKVIALYHKVDETFPDLENEVQSAIVKVLAELNKDELTQLKDLIEYVETHY